MKIILYSDLHLEFGTNFKPPKDANCDLMILAGDIIVLKDFDPLGRFLEGWNKPVIYVMGNHEHYTKRPMHENESAFRVWITDQHPNVTVLQNEAITIQGVNFFGGTMWTDFFGSDQKSMESAYKAMNDFRLIKTLGDEPLKPVDTVAFHQDFKASLIKWFETPIHGPRVVITHHAPALNPDTRYTGSHLIPAFSSLDMLEVIEKYQPQLWVYGHTHECDKRAIGSTQIVSNQLGYPNGLGGFECPNFDKLGRPIDI